MLILQALDEGRNGKLLIDYNSFMKAVIAMYGNMDQRSNMEDHLGNIKQTKSMATYISMFNEYATQVDWNESSFVVHFCRGLKDENLDSIAIVETKLQGLQKWMVMASKIDKRL